MDIASSVITATATTASSTHKKDYYTVGINVTAASGTNETYAVEIQEYSDRRAAWETVYMFPIITATGRFVSPTLKRYGSSIRYVQTIGGTDSPSFTRSISLGAAPANDRPGFTTQLIDRALTVNTINSATSAIYTKGAKSVQMVVRMGAITTTAPQFTLQGTLDGTNWYSLGSALTSVASSTVQLTVNNINADRVRINTSTGGSGATLGEIVLRSFEP
jgi:hypothetical protein